MENQNTDSNHSTSSSTSPSSSAESQRWSHIRKLLERSGPFCQPGFTPSPENLELLKLHCRLLVVGAGGLGCELLKNLALLGFCNIHVIDMDTIDISNLNRQFLFRNEDVGKSKAEVAAGVINKRIPGVSVVPHFCKIQDKDEEFYSSFHIIICGLDSIVARRWLNGMIMSLVKYDDDGAALEDSLIPIVDGGTEGFKGNARVIIPTKTPCIECTLDLYPPQVNFPLCTIAQTPRLPEHCIEYARIILWPKENSDSPIDGDDPAHINWIYERALERANEFKIPGVTYRLTQGVIKHIIPAVSSTNAAISSVCATETFKMVTGCSKYLENYNYMIYSDLDGIYTYTYAAEKSDDCLACSQKPRSLTFSPETTLLELIEFLIESREYQMKSPGITSTLSTGKQKTLYMKLISQTEANLTKSLQELGVESGGQITVADETTPIARTFIINYPTGAAAAAAIPTAT